MKKNYIIPEMQVVNISSLQLLAGSIDAPGYGEEFASRDFESDADY